MERIHTYVITLLCAVLAALLWAACVALAGAELPRTQRTVQGLKAAPGGRLLAFPQSASTEQIQPSAPATPEVTQLRPDCAAGGGKAIEMVLAGKNFPGPFPNAVEQKGRLWRFFPEIRCERGGAGGSFEPKVESLTFESPTRAVARVLIPESTEKAHCELALGPAALARLKLEILNPEPMEVQAHFIAEGNLSPKEVLGRNAHEPHPGAMGLLSASPSTVKFVQGDKTVFDKPASSLKALEEFKAPFQIGHQGFFRIVFNDGKVYNFVNFWPISPVCVGGEYMEVSAYQALKKKFGK